MGPMKVYFHVGEYVNVNEAESRGWVIDIQPEGAPIFLVYSTDGQFRWVHQLFLARRPETDRDIDLKEVDRLLAIYNKRIDRRGEYHDPYEDVCHDCTAEGGCHNCPEFN